MTCKPDRTWFVTYHARRQQFGWHTRQSEQFASEQDAKIFANDRWVEGLEVTAGTLNPHLPKRFIGSRQIKKWLDEQAEDRRVAIVGSSRQLSHVSVIST